MHAVGNGLSLDSATAIEKRERELREAAAPVPEYQQRVIDEKKALDEKLEKLIHWMETSAVFLVMPAPDQNLLRLQRGHMRCYSDILGMRIDGFVKEESNG